MAGIIVLTAWPIRGDFVPHENGGKLTLTSLFRQIFSFDVSEKSKSLMACFLLQKNGNQENTSLAAPGALANHLQCRIARKANKANLDFPNLKTEITSL